MDIKIYQGNKLKLPQSDINVVIDVIRAFTFAHIAFLRNAKKIILSSNKSDCFVIRKKYKNLVLAGEEQGIRIKGFDYGNSPASIINENFQNKILVQKTTNGVNAALNSLNADKVITTGLTNVSNTIKYIKNHLISYNENAKVNIIASHPSSDEDYAVAEYIKSALMNENKINAVQVVQRILKSDAAQKFLDTSKEQFDYKDLEICTNEINGEEFVMLVNISANVPFIERINLYDS
ncbi:2-phosphosulfolactate phosphatase [Salibacterium salarium]|uniref:2-phosphosulfolactate phosphatase n=1 Tax=Salibacterium salarium TaxID=284579 RepID=UPI00277EBC6C|nr:2-phosphosulfolactate phosphatase [Salibacterium salarium]MDQ0298227.1 2-phosphosulfolactate phosphatase [Salibacterium salarium]